MHIYSDRVKKKSDEFLHFIVAQHLFFPNTPIHLDIRKCSSWYPEIPKVIRPEHFYNPTKWLPVFLLKLYSFYHIKMHFSSGWEVKWILHNFHCCDLMRICLPRFRSKFFWNALFGQKQPRVDACFSVFLKIHAMALSWAFRLYGPNAHPKLSEWQQWWQEFGCFLTW